jgi:hypothetical protein
MYLRVQRGPHLRQFPFERQNVQTWRFCRCQFNDCAIVDFHSIRSKRGR